MEAPDSMRPAVPQDDLAAIVLGQRTPGTSRIAGWDALADAHPKQGYDARSVLVLVLVVAILAAVVGWAMTLVRPEQGLVAGPNAQRAVDPSPAPAQKPASSRSERRSTAQPEPVSLGITRISLDGSTPGVARLRVAVRNDRSAAVGASLPLEVLVLVDGEPAGRGWLASVPSRASRVVDVQLDRCPSAAANVLAILDPRGVALERPGSGNVLLRRISFTC